MESLACVHLALAYTEPTPTLRFKSWNLLNCFQKLKYNVRPLRPMLALLSLSIAASIITFAGSALAALKLHDTGPQVTTLQEDLKTLGYFSNSATGYFGELTQNGLIRFQESQGLEPDGVAGQKTMAAIDRALGQITTQNYNNPTVNTPTVNTNFKLGDQGTEVEELQKQLTKLGFYTGPISGYYGPQTQTAVRQFQQERKLNVSGEVDSQTLAELQLDKPATPPQAKQPPEPENRQPENTFNGQLKLGDTGSQVSQLQRDLKELNYYKGEITGEFDQTTEAALIRFQRENGLVSDGIFGPRSQDKLVSIINNQDVETSSRYANPYSVAELQIKLKDQGFYKGSVDNDFSSQTKLAVQKAQDKYGVRRTDIGYR